jgi:hypothetical protein
MTPDHYKSSGILIFLVSFFEMVKTGQTHYGLTLPVGGIIHICVLIHTRFFLYC